MNRKELNKLILEEINKILGKKPKGPNVHLYVAFKRIVTGNIRQKGNAAEYIRHTLQNKTDEQAKKITVRFLKHYGMSRDEANETCEALWGGDF